MNNKQCKKCNKNLGNESVDGYCNECWNNYHSFNNVAIITKTLSVVIALLGFALAGYWCLKISLVIGLAIMVLVGFFGTITFALGELIFKLQNLEDIKNN